jgi:predicted alpha/beta superfamily hydrolase
VILAALLAGAAASAPSASATPIVLGTSYHWQSPTMGEDRVVNVVLPDGYEKQANARYPVLYVIDGGIDQDLIHISGTEKLNAAWGRSGDAIIVGIATKDRRRELVGPTADAELLKQYPTAGHSAQFRRFIRDEVQPFVARRFRTNGSSAVIGESLAGLFIVESYLTEPDLFGAYGAVSPSTWWDKEALSLTAAAKIGSAQSTHALYLAVGNEGAEVRRADGRVVSAISGKVARWCYAEHPELAHSTIYHAVSPELLQFVLPPAQAPSPEFGFEVRCSRKS